MNRSGLISLWLFLCCTAAGAAEPDALWLLKIHLGSAIEAESPGELRYCPDNTCEIFRVSSEAHRAQLPGFVFLYLFHISDYAYLDESSPSGIPFRNVAKNDESLIRQSMQLYCRKLDKSPQCIIEGMQQELGISLHFGRYDEGSFHEIPVADGPEV